MSGRRFREGIGHLKAEEINRTQRAAAEVERRTPTLSRAARELQTPPYAATMIWARITGATPMAGEVRRWAYAFKQVRWDKATKLFVDVPSPSGITGTAYNAIEEPNSASQIAPGIDPSDLPAGQDLVELKYGVPVPLYAVRCDDGSTEWIIATPGAIGGPCP